MRARKNRPTPQNPTAKIARASFIAIVAIAGAMIGASQWDQSEAAVVKFNCHNIYSGTKWDVNVDFDRATADSYPAQITKSLISWRDAKEGANYELNPESGALTQYAASSMGGTLWFHKCVKG
jgi:hypothetical protein